ncbi:hypothetical protein DM292_07490 [Stutzerimonas frequens]|nr:hypothetical protein DM292_07490 [Stutzerimonas frequens]
MPFTYDVWNHQASSQILRTQMRVGPINLVVVARILRLHLLQRRLHDDGQTFEMLKDTAPRDFTSPLLVQADIGFRW